MEPLGNKITKIEAFLNERLKTDLERVLSNRDKLYEDLANYTQLQSMIQELISNNMNAEPLKTKVDLGCNFYAQANVPDPSKICINIGLGIYVEFALEEALVHIDKRVVEVNKSINSMSDEAAKIKAHIKVVLEGLREMQNLQVDNPEPQRDVFA